MNTSPVDYLDDVNGQQLYALDTLYGLPAFVKTAEQEDAGVVRGYPSNVFADPSRKKFPLHSKAAAWLAQGYFLASRTSYGKKEAEFVQSRIDKMAEYHGIAADTRRLKGEMFKSAAFEQPGLTDADYALTTIVEGKTVRRFPINNPPAVKAAGDYLHANRFMYPLPMRKMAARNILKRAVQFDERAARGETLGGAPLHATRFEPEVLDYLEKAACFGVGDPDMVAQKIAYRVLMTEGAGPEMLEHREAMAKLAEWISDQEHLSPAQLEKIAGAVDAYDRESGLYTAYSDGHIDLPEEFCFTVLEKHASAAADNFVLLTTGNSWPIENFLTLPLEKIAELLGEEFVGEVKAADGGVDLVKFIEVARTLPRDDAALLERAMRSAVKEASEELVKAARAPGMADRTWTREEVIAAMKKEGRKVNAGSGGISGDAINPSPLF